MTTLAAELCALAVDLGSAAGVLILQGRVGGVTSITTKSSGNDMVTEFDRASERLIVDGILAARPDDGIVGEEGTAHPTSTGIVWHIDPIDGTTNFLYNLPGYAVSIAAVDDIGPLVGVVIVPAWGETFAATRGGGAFSNGERLSVSTTTDVSHALVATGFSYLAEKRHEQGVRLTHLLPRVRDIRRLGAASVDLCHVAAGRLDVYYEENLNSWDIAAGMLIAQEAGAVVTDFAGGAAHPGQILASTPGVADAIRGLLTD